MPSVSMTLASTDEATDTTSTLKIGEVMPAGHAHAGWIYAGISNTTGKPFYAASKDSGVYQWKEAMAFAASEKANLPSDAELNQLYRAKNQGAFKGTFNETRWPPAGVYWSATEHGDDADFAWDQRFSDGDQVWLRKFHQGSVRLVRS
jgi:Protein of unknown function (DUF1566)